MKSAGPYKQFVIIFLVVLALYAIAYTGVEHLRTRKGPWEVTFAQDATSNAAMVVNQPMLGISNAIVSFPGEAAAQTRSLFLYREAKPVPFDVPYGKCVFMDAISLPGTIAFNLFGHEVQLMPRVLTIDKKEYPWKSDSTLVVTNKPILQNPVGH